MQNQINPCYSGVVIRPYISTATGARGFDYHPANMLKEFKPKTDIFEDAGFVHFEVELPGVDKENIKVQIDEKNILKIEGRKYTGLETEKLYIRRFELSDKLNSNEIRADYENGVLAVKIAKKVPEEKIIDIK